MRKIEFYGHSDDVFIADGDESSYYTVKVSDGDDALIVRANYTDRGVWNIGIEPVDEDIPIPNWDMKWTLAECGYSSLLTITAPDGTVTESIPS